ncbi:MAG: GntR family transcriptional regulator [Rhodospirillaceae bacterium]|nr:GntR family transcriptional regulator [Rhodospirillaceae bacterium]
MSKPTRGTGGGRSANQSRAGQVLDSLRQAIRDGHYAPGERVRETEVAAALGVSRTPVREAFRQLQADGLLTMEPWRGVVVAQMDQQQMVELYAMRQVLEGTAAGLAARHAAASQVAALGDLLDASEGETDAVKLADLNRQFHQGIYDAAHNRFLLKALNALRDSMALLPSTTYALAERPPSALVEHRDILTAIERHDADGAERAARAHIAQAERARLKVVLEWEREHKGDEA